MLLSFILSMLFINDLWIVQISLNLIQKNIKLRSLAFFVVTTTYK